MEKRSRRNLSESLSDVVAEALNNRVFSACSIGYFWRDKGELFFDSQHHGMTDFSGEGSEVGESTMYDLASLTKPLVTALSFMALVDQGQVTLDEELGTIFPELRDEMAGISISMLLSHCSGLPAHRPYYRTIGNYPLKKRKEAVFRLICRESLIFKPGNGSLYSDLGYILLGLVLEKITGVSLAEFWKERIALPLGLDTQLIYPDFGLLSSSVFAATGAGWSEERLCGIVHDDNCRMMGGIAGHAGLFGTLTGVLFLVGNLLRQFLGETRHPAYSNGVLRQFLTRRKESTWSCGFDSPTPGISSSGRFFSQRTVGHLGFTGTSFWLDLDKCSAIVLLTNRVLMGDDPLPIRKFRPLLHDMIMKDILDNKKPG